MWSKMLLKRVKFVNKKVLIVDDEPDMHHLLKKFIRKMDEEIEVVSAYTGEEGIEKYRKMHEMGDAPSLIIMDLNLSGRKGIEKLDEHIEGKDEKMSGAQATAEILKINPRATIWGYTAWFSSYWKDALKKAGAERVIERSVPFHEVAKMIKDFLEKE